MNKGTGKHKGSGCTADFLNTYLVEHLVEYAKFVGCKHEPTQPQACKASENKSNDSKGLHVRTRKQTPICENK